MVPNCMLFTENGTALCECKAQNVIDFLMSLLDAGELGLDEHVIALVHTILCAGLKCLRSLRGPGSSSEATMRKLKIHQISSSGGWLW